MLVGVKCGRARVRWWRANGGGLGRVNGGGPSDSSTLWRDGFLAEFHFLYPARRRVLIGQKGASDFGVGHMGIFGLKMVSFFSF